MLLVAKQSEFDAPDGLWGCKVLRARFVGLGSKIDKKLFENNYSMCGFQDSYFRGSCSDFVVNFNSNAEDCCLVIAK